MPSDFQLFMSQLFRRPHEVVALAPSSQWLAREMAARIDPAGGPVVELGAGTGTITRAILDRGLPAAMLHSIDMNPAFCDRLRATVPGLNVHLMSAGDLGRLPVGDVQAVISGLPLLSMPVALQDAILSGAMTLLRPGAEYVQFTYGPKPPVARQVREALGLRWTTSETIWWNMPPARVYRFSRATA